jgi:hypothetical protein
MKALFLKSVEVLHHLDEASRFTQDSHRTSKERNLAKRKQSTFSSLFKSAKSKANDKARAAALGLDAKPEAQSSELERKIAGAAERTEREAELRSLRAQAQVASSILEMLKSNSVAIVDEVDVILDPLKSACGVPFHAIDASSPSDEVVAGFFFDFGAVPGAPDSLVDLRTGRSSTGLWAPGRLSTSRRRRTRRVFGGGSLIFYLMRLSVRH